MFCVAVALAIQAAAVHAQRILIGQEQLVDVRAGGMIPRPTVVVADGISVSPRDGVTPAATDQVIDLPGLTLLSGLIGAHVYLSIAERPEPASSRSRPRFTQASKR